MPLISEVFTLSATVPTQVVASDNMPQDVVLHNMTKSSNEYIHIGDENVTTSNSIHLDPGQTISFTIGPLDALYAVSNPDGLVLGVLAIRRRD